MYKLSAIILIFLLTGFDLVAQPQLKINPQTIHFKSVFDRNEYTLLINEGNETLRIDSLTSKKPFYFYDFEPGLKLPVDIIPGDTIKLNITLANFYNVTVADTSDTIFVYNNGDINSDSIVIKIDFFDNDYGNCAGKVTDDSLNPIENSKIYFFYWGVYLFDSTYTNAAGDYNALLPKGSYTVGAYKEGYRAVFSGNTNDPFFSEPVNIDSGGTVNINLTLSKLAATLYSISGSLVSPSGTAISDGIVVIRKGTHTPTTMKVDSVQNPSVYAGFVDESGNYNINVDESGYYYVQGFANNFLPGYYNTQNVPSLFWQTADSVLINSTLPDKNLLLLRDSSYGAGGVSGKVSFSTSSTNDFEGITLFAKSVLNGKFYSYNFCKSDRNYYLSNLPYGSYRIVAQKIGFENAESEVFIIDSSNTYYYNVNIILNVTHIENEDILPDNIILDSNYPNPFNPSTTISFSLPETNLVNLKVYNLLGEEIAVLINDVLELGRHKFLFEANGLPSGVYFYRLQAGSFIETKKMILLK